MPSLSTKKVAIAHDWLIGGGAEKVVLELHRIFPEAPIYTSYSTDEWRANLDYKVITGYLGHWPFSKIRKFVPYLRAHWFSHLDLSAYDLIISSSGAEAKGIKVPKGTVHINYCHAPTHYYWSRYDEYIQNPGFGALNWLARIGLKLLLGPMRKWDYSAAQRPDFILANSTHIQKEIMRFYGRGSTVIHPPIDVERFEPYAKNQSRKGFVITGRQTPYKRVDLAVSACTKLNLPLNVIGSGPDHKRLVSLAGPTIHFLTNVSDIDLPRHLSEAGGFIFPALDDFGVSAVEALAAGTPLVAFEAGGALDYVVSGQTGDFFSEQNIESLTAALKAFDPSKFDPQTLVKKANDFSPKIFQHNILEFIKINVV
jgi:glycosyltransferase involved in cell wall biosynthesis